MNESIKKKINGLGRAGQILAIVMIIVSAINFTYCLFNLLPVFRPMLDSVVSLVESSSEFAEGSGLVGILKEIWIDGGVSIILMISSCVGGMLSNIGYAVAYGFLLRVSKNLRRCDTPFEDGVIRATAVFGWVLFGVSVLSSVFNVLTMIYYNDAFSMLTNLLPSFSLVFSLIVLFLVRVFRHGAELQKERDETL